MSKIIDGVSWVLLPVNIAVGAHFALAGNWWLAAWSAVGAAFCLANVTAR